VRQSLDAPPISKRMRWGASRTEFVRPAQWLVMLFGSDVVPGKVLGLPAGRETRGHRFHCNQSLPLARADLYAEVLKNDGKVIADFSERKQRVRQQVEAEAAKTGGRVVIEEDLLDE